MERREEFLSAKIKEERRSQMPPGDPDTDEELDLSWKPLIKVVSTNTEHRDRAKL